MNHWHAFEFSLSFSSDHFWITLTDKELFLSICETKSLSVLFSTFFLWLADHFFPYTLHPELSYIPFLWKHSAVILHVCIYFISAKASFLAFSPVYVPDLLILLFAKSSSSNPPQLWSQHCYPFMPKNSEDLHLSLALAWKWHPWPQLQAADGWNPDKLCNTAILWAQVVFPRLI